MNCKTQIIVFIDYVYCIISLVGLQVELFCLEQSRVCGSYISTEHHPPGAEKVSRNFHIFYQMIAGLTKVGPKSGTVYSQIRPTTIN